MPSVKELAMLARSLGIAPALRMTLGSQTALLLLLDFRKGLLADRFRPTDWQRPKAEKNYCHRAVIVVLL